MLFSLRHGQHVVQDAAPRPADATLIMEASAGCSADEVPLSAVLGAAPQARSPATLAAAPAADPALGKFAYYFPDEAGVAEQPGMPQLLDDLADSMVEAGGDPRAANARIPAVMTYLGQFIDHDITANTDREAGASTIPGAIAPLARGDVEGEPGAPGLLGNIRDGSLALDSLYGDTLGQGDFARKLSGLLRSTTFPGKMRLAFPARIGGRVPLPVDNAADLLRLGRLLDEGAITRAELEALEPAELRDTFLKNGEPIRTRAIIGDGRNDENLIVAQLHVLFLRLHNTLVDRVGAANFEDARRLTRWHYQWLVVNAYLPTVCDLAVLDDVIAQGAPLYAGLLAKHGALGPKLPMPLEFSVAAFRFGHSMVRGAYDHNRIFGARTGDGEHLADSSPFDLLFAFTGSGGMPPSPVPTDPPNASGQLPQRWVIEWERFLKVDPARPERATRRIDTSLAPPLKAMANEAAGVFQHLARRNLRRGYRLNVPTAQGCIAGLLAAGVAPFRVLTPEQIRLKASSPEENAAVTAGGFDAATPLWFYVLKEAEVLGCGERLGPLGSHLVAQTLVGLVAHDPGSYWNAPGGRWAPEQFDAESPIDSLEDVARVCGML